MKTITYMYEIVVLIIKDLYTCTFMSSMWRLFFHYFYTIFIFSTCKYNVCVDFNCLAPNAYHVCTCKVVEKMTKYMQKDGKENRATNFLVFSLGVLSSFRGEKTTERWLATFAPISKRHATRKSQLYMYTRIPPTCTCSLIKRRETCLLHSYMQFTEGKNIGHWHKISLQAFMNFNCIKILYW